MTRHPTNTSLLLGSGTKTIPLSNLNSCAELHMLHGPRISHRKKKVIMIINSQDCSRTLYISDDVRPSALCLKRADSTPFSPFVSLLTSLPPKPSFFSLLPPSLSLQEPQGAHTLTLNIIPIQSFTYISGVVFATEYPLGSVHFSFSKVKRRLVIISSVMKVSLMAVVTENMKYSKLPLG